MSFQNNGLWMPKDADCLTDGELTYDSTSKIEPKRPHLWFMDNSEADLFPNKKQAVEVPSSSAFTGLQPSTLSSWGSTSGFNSVPSQLNEILFVTDARNVNFDERSAPPVIAENLNVGRDPFGNTSSFGLSMSHKLEDPRLGINYGGIRKVKVSEVRDSENPLPVSIGSSYTREASVISDQSYNKVDGSGISMGLTYGREDDDVTKLGESFSREGGNLISVGQSFNKGDDNTMSMGHIYDADGSNTPIPVSDFFTKTDNNILSMAESLSKGHNNAISLGNPSTREENIISMSQSFKGDSSVSVSSNYSKDIGSVTSVSRSNLRGKGQALSMGLSFDQGESNIISFGGEHDGADAPGRLSCSYDLLMGQTSGQRSNTFNHQDLLLSNANTVISTAQVISSGTESSSKKKEDHKSVKKIPPNNFPSNVRSLLSTGILDDIPVKYIAWSREKELRAIIKGSGYLCGCQLCNFSKVINAYEFERHAGCKTKHPNNHIYFDNGKTIYGIVQELRSTPQNMLFDAIQTITGSPINQKSFRLWKESFLAATRELQRIYGKDDRNQFL